VSWEVLSPPPPPPLWLIIISSLYKLFFSHFFLSPLSNGMAFGILLSFKDYMTKAIVTFTTRNYEFIIVKIKIYVNESFQYQIVNQSVCKKINLMFMK
jgi:hypothetical protein